MGTHSWPSFRLGEGPMQRIKLSIHEDQAIYLNDHERQGYKDKSAMMREALNLLKKTAGVTAIG